MPRLALANMMFGFVILFLAAAGGAFIASDMSEGFLRDPQILDSWQLALLKSAHGHFNLFGLLHVALGLTLPYSALGARTKLWQSVGLGLGAVAMGPVMMVRAGYGPAESTDPIGLVIGALLSCALLSLVSHAAGLGMKLMRRA